MNIQDEQKLHDALEHFEQWLRAIVHGSYDDARNARIKIIEFVKQAMDAS